MSMAGAIVTVAGVTRRYGARTALADVGFTVGAGELCGSGEAVGRGCPEGCNAPDCRAVVILQD